MLTGTPGVISAPGPTPIPEPPPVDLSIHRVPLDEVIFDTFDGGTVRLSDASELTILRLRDANRPLYEPVRYQDVDGGDWLSDSDTVIGYAVESGAFAYSCSSWPALIYRVAGRHYMIVRKDSASTEKAGR